MSLRENRAIVAVLIVFAVLSASYSFVTRLKYGPDEPAHFIYIRSLACDFALPPLSTEVTPTQESTSSHEAHQPPLYYALMAVPFAVLDALGASDVVLWRVLRLLNIPLGVVFLLGVYALAFEFFRDSHRALVTVSLAALLPTACYTAGVINNENLVSPLFTWSLIPLLMYFRSGTMARQSSLWMGLLIGLSILAKAQGLVLVVLLMVASVAVLRRESYRNWRPVLATTSIVLGVALLVSGWWFVRSLMVYGEMMPQSLYNPAFPDGLVAALVVPGQFLAVAFSATCLTYGHFWIPYWLIQPCVAFLDYLYPLCAVTFVMLVGLVLAIRKQRELDRRGLGFLLLAPVMVYLLWLRHALVVDMGANMQGRLFLCVAGVAGISAVLAIEGLVRGRVSGGVIKALAMGVLVVANAAVLVCARVLYS